MKLGTKLIAGFLVVALILVAVIATVFVLQAQVERSRDKAKRAQENLNDMTKLTSGLREEQTLAIKYITTDEHAETEAILREKELLSDKNFRLFADIHEEHKREEDDLEYQNTTFENIENNMEAMDELFEGYVELRYQKTSNEFLLLNITNDIDDTWHELNNNYFINPLYTNSLAEYHMVSGKNRTAQSVFQNIAYYEKEYIWQYKDQAHLDKLKDVIADLVTIITFTSLPQNIKDEIDTLFNTYEGFVDEVLPYIEEYDFDKLTAQEAKFLRKIWFIKHDEIMDNMINNPAYDNMFEVYRNLSVDGVAFNKSMEQLYWELGHYEKGVLYQDRGVITDNYLELLQTIKTSKAYLNATPLDADNRTTFFLVFDSYLGYINDFIDNRQVIVFALDELEQQQSSRITALDQLLNQLMVGQGNDDKEGFDFIIDGHYNEIEVLMEDVDSTQQSLYTAILVGIITTIVASILLGLVISRSIRKPVIEMTDAAEEIKNGNLEVSVKETGKDEITELAKTFNVMTYNLKQEIDQRNTAEENLKRTVVELKRSNAELEKFAYVASHDLQEPQRMVVSYLQLLERRYKGKLDSDADEFINYAVSGAIRMKLLINDLLTYSRIGSGARPFKPTPLESVIDETLTDLQGEIEENGAEVTHTFLPTVTVDETEFTRLFKNLISNAIKFHGKEPPHIHISTEQRENEWLFSVRDNGIGIEPQYCKRIFQLFQRLHSEEEYPGTGIGLALCKKIVERHGGRIWMESEPGKGSTFYFTIPKIGDDLK